MNTNELKNLEYFAEDVIRVHDKLSAAIEEANREGIEIKQKLISLYVSLKSEIRQNKKQEDLNEPD